MYNSSNLVKLCKDLFSELATDNQIIASYRKLDYKPTDINKNIKLVGRLYLQHALQSMQKEVSDLELKSVNDGSESQWYVFNYEVSGELGAYQKSYKRKPRKYHLYDSVVLLGDLPVIFEVKFSTWKSAKSRYDKKRRKRIFKTSVITSMRKEVYKKPTLPIRELFQHEVGYVLVIPKDVHNQSERSESPILKEFYSRGGILTPFPMERIQFREHVEKILEKVGK